MPKHKLHSLPHIAPGAGRKQKKQRDQFKFIIYFFTVATPLFEIPQAITIYTHHNAQNVSIWTWSFFLIDNVVWIIYGLRCKTKPLVITSILYLIIEMMIVAGIVRYS
jgi:uncharacterized protein with PQ loop repeat